MPCAPSRILPTTESIKKPAMHSTPTTHFAVRCFNKSRLHEPIQTKLALALLHARLALSGTTMTPVWEDFYTPLPLMFHFVTCGSCGVMEIMIVAVAITPTVMRGDGEMVSCSPCCLLDMHDGVS